VQDAVNGLARLKDGLGSFRGRRKLTQQVRRGRELFELENTDVVDLMLRVSFQGRHIKDASSGSTIASGPREWANYNHNGLRYTFGDPTVR
jgi:hypothetical protein